MQGIAQAVDNTISWAKSVFQKILQKISGLIMGKLIEPVLEAIHGFLETEELEANMDFEQNKPEAPTNLLGEAPTPPGPKKDKKIGLSSVCVWHGMRAHVCACLCVDQLLS